MYCIRLLSEKLQELKNHIQNAVVNRVVEDFIDIATPLRQFTEAVHVPEGIAFHKEQSTLHVCRISRFGSM